MNINGKDFRNALFLGFMSLLWTMLESILKLPHSGGVYPTAFLFGWYVFVGVFLYVFYVRKRTENGGSMTFFQTMSFVATTCILMSFIAIPLQYFYIELAEKNYFEKVVAELPKKSQAVGKEFATFKNYTFAYLTFAIGLGGIYGAILGLINRPKKSLG